MERLGRVILVLAILGGLLGASLGFRLGLPITPEYILKNAERSLEATQDFHGHFSLWVQPPGGSIGATELKGEVWARKPDKLRLEVKEAPLAELKVTVIGDGERICLYNPAAKAAAILDPETLARDLASILPPELASKPSPPPEKVSINDVFQVEGREVLGGRRAYRLAVVPPLPEGLPEVEVKLWIEELTWMPIQVAASSSQVGAVRATLLDYQRDRGLDERLFVCQFPAGTVVKGVEELLPQVRPQVGELKGLSLAEARAAAPFPLLVPAWVPEGFQLRAVLRMPGESYTLTYLGPGGKSFSLVESRAKEALKLPALASGREKTLSLRGQEGAAMRADPGIGKLFLSWQEKGVYIAIAGDLSEADALRLAESLAP